MIAAVTSTKPESSGPAEQIRAGASSAEGDTSTGPERTVVREDRSASGNARMSRHSSEDAHGDRRMQASARDFIDLADLDRHELRQVLDRAHEIKAGRWQEKPLAGRHIAMLFQKPSHRTRVSFEVGIARLGGATTTLTEQDVQLGVRESVEDAARVLDRYVDGVVARMRSHEDLLKLARASAKPVINGLTEQSHPCQILADLMTIEEARGDLTRQSIVFIGDGNNIVNSLIDAAELTGLTLTVVTPPGYEPEVNAGGVTITNDLPPLENASVIYTDVWTSMGQESERDARRKAFAAYQVNQRLMSRAPNAVFMHCLPAHRGEEVTDEVIDGPQSIVFEQAGNRLYAQMALLAELLPA